LLKDSSYLVLQSRNMEPSFTFPLVRSLVFLIMTKPSLEFVNLKVSESPKCVINLVILDVDLHGINRSTLFIDGLIANNNKPNQRWTIGTMNEHGEPEMLLYGPRWRLVPEDCSVNIAIATLLNDCIPGYIVDLFGSRVYSEKNSLIFIYGGQSECKGRNIWLKDVEYLRSPILLGVYFFYMDKEMAEVAKAYTLCTRCSASFKLSKFPIPVPSLGQMRKLSNAIRRNPFSPLHTLFLRSLVFRPLKNLLTAASGSRRTT